LSSESASSNNGSESRAKQVTVQRIVVAGYIIALAMPPLGLAIGLVLMLSRGMPSKHGAWIVLVSVVAAVIWALMISSGALTASNQGY
jgi:hypothetical protein